MKKMITLLLVVCVAAASFAVGKEETGATGPAHPRAGQVNRFGWKIPAQRITIRQYEGQDNPESSELRLRFMRAYLLEEFNVDIDRIVYDTDKNERLNLMLASNTYPGVITWLDDAQYANWVFQGRAQEISGLVNKLGPNIKKELGDLYPRYLSADGKLYGAPVNWGLLHNPGYTAHIRWDVYLAHGSPKLVTLDDYYDLHQEAGGGEAPRQQGEQDLRAVPERPGDARDPQRLLGSAPRLEDRRGHEDRAALDQHAGRPGHGPVVQQGAARGHARSQRLHQQVRRLEGSVLRRAPDGSPGLVVAHLERRSRGLERAVARLEGRPAVRADRGQGRRRRQSDDRAQEHDGLHVHHHGQGGQTRGRDQVVELRDHRPWAPS